MHFDQIKLYQSSGSPNSRRVRIFLAKKGLSIPQVPVDLGKGEQHSQATNWWGRTRSTEPRIWANGPSFAAKEKTR